MNIDTVMNQIETYYGNYENVKLKAFVKAYLMKDYKEEKFDEILKSILYYHKAAFKAPCIASIEECIKLARAEKELNKNKGITTKNKWDYREQAKTDKDFDKVNASLTDVFKQTIKKVGE
ncbi:MAG: hypothetical protein GY928_21495 [Colwellia sp.]|nr:hypothetical protein [Colwellia sp.]